MTQNIHDYRFIIGKPGQTDLTESTNHDLTLSTTDGVVRVTQIDPFGGQRVRGVEAHAESMPWKITLQESSTGEEVTGKLASSTLLGPDMMRRTVRLDVSRGAGGFSSGFDPGAFTGERVGAGGRVTDLAVNQDEQTYEFTVRDALFTARTAGAFSTNDTQILPRGPTTDFFSIPSAGNEQWRVVEKTSNNFAKVSPTNRPIQLTQDLAEIVLDDEVGGPQPGQENYRNLKIRSATGDEWGVERIMASPGDNPSFALSELLDQSTGERVYFNHLTLATTALEAGSSFAAGDTFDGFLHAFGRDPSTELPLHYGGSTGVDPMQFVKDRYDEANVRTPSTLYQTHSTNKPNAMLDHPLTFSPLYYRITEKTTSLQDWLQNNVFTAHGVAPLVDDEGRVAPTYMRQPPADAVPATSDLFTFSSSNIADEHPTWDEGTNEQITEADVRVEMFRRDLRDPSRSADHLLASTAQHTFQQNTTIFGTHQRRVLYRGRGYLGLQAAESIANDSFQRFGYGPIRARFRGMSDASTVRAGDLVVLDVPTFPKAPDAVRGGQQIFQVLSRTGTVRGPDFEALELGPKAQPTTAPTVSINKATTNPKHAVDLSVSNLVSGAEGRIRLAASSIEPADNSEWDRQDLVIASSSATITESQLPSGNTIWAEARAVKTNEIASEWSTADSTVLDSIPGPTTLTATSTRKERIEYNWSNGSTAYGTHLILQSTIQKNKPAGSETGMVFNISSTGTLSVAVQHFDEFGGKSSQYSTSVTMSTNIVNSPDVQNLTVSNGFFSGGSGSSLIFF